MMVIRCGQGVRNIAVDQVFAGGPHFLSLNSINWNQVLRLFCQIFSRRFAPSAPTSTAGHVSKPEQHRPHVAYPLFPLGLVRLQNLRLPQSNHVERDRGVPSGTKT